MNIRKLCIAIAVTAAGIALTPRAEAGRHSGGHSASAGHAGGGFHGGGHSFNHGGSFQRGGASNFRGASISHGRNNGSFRGSAFNRPGGGMGNARVGSNHRNVGGRTVALGNGNGRYRTGFGSHNNWGGRHHGSDHHSRLHHHDYGYGYGLAGLGLFGYPYGGYGYGSGYGYGGYGSSYASGNGYGYDNGSVAADVQSALAELGLYRGPIDGVLGQRSLQAIASFQAQNGMRPTGRIDQRLLNALQNG